MVLVIYGGMGIDVFGTGFGLLLVIILYVENIEVSIRIRMIRIVICSLFFCVIVIVV